MSYSGGLQYGYAELMQMNGIPLYAGVGPETGFRYRCKLRPQRAGRVKRHRHNGVWWASLEESIGHFTRAQAAQAAYGE
ncbi:hypothetical protein LCGC14_2785930 [marine sediment metagenome]|uniref:Uncharacterized protein n=1 Tax=marine sediment metagenome TaxID=412755 RepID=A0A0F8YRX6_9ZZZZ